MSETGRDWFAKIKGAGLTLGAVAKRLGLPAKALTPVLSWGTLTADQKKIVREMIREAQKKRPIVQQEAEETPGEGT